MTEREIIEYRHLASNQTLMALFDAEEKRLLSKILAATRGDDDAGLRNAAIALEVLTNFRRKLTQMAKRSPDEEETR